jgi:hypothetical protein
VVLGAAGQVLVLALFAAEGGRSVRRTVRHKGERRTLDLRRALRTYENSNGAQIVGGR